MILDTVGNAGLPGLLCHPSRDTRTPLRAHGDDEREEGRME
jgi:hypothetical protein